MGQRCTFIVPGKPQAWKRPAQGRHPVTGAVMRFSDKAMEAHKRVVATEAMCRWTGGPVTGPVILRVIGIFAIPPSWPKKLQEAARDCRVPHIADPDLDQIVKLVQDALVGIVYVDDNQVCGYPNSAKRYGQPERTEITVEVLDQLEDAKTPGQRRLEARPPKERLISGKAADKLRRNRSKTRTLSAAERDHIYSRRGLINP